MRARGIEASRILEPTCGSGAFLRAAGAAFSGAAHFVGIEYQRERYEPELRALARDDARMTLHFGNAYEIDFAQLPWRRRGPLLVLGNPPWVTAAALGRVTVPVLTPPRSNFKGLPGLAARTGAANFDVAEFLIFKLLRELRAEPLHLALLVKESVARHVVAMLAVKPELGVTSAEVVRIDARAWFDVAVDACCFIISAAPNGSLHAPVLIRAAFDGAPIGEVVLSVPTSKGPGRVVFRQGIKHDAADVFELRERDGHWQNGYGERVDVESTFVYPLRKAGALHAGRYEPTALVVPQERLGAPTAGLQTQAPRLWRYLRSHAARIKARRSSIYRNAPEFALFGIGPYSFAPWKVAVAGFYREPRFRVLGPEDGRPVMLGDTAYFAAFEHEAEARAFARRCTSPNVVSEIAWRARRGKRPITKALLDSLDWESCDSTSSEARSRSGADAAGEPDVSASPI